MKIRLKLHRHMTGPNNEQICKKKHVNLFFFIRGNQFSLSVQIERISNIFCSTIDYI